MSRARRPSIYFTLIIRRETRLAAALIDVACVL